MKLEDEIKQKKFKDDYQKLMLNIIFTGNWLNSKSIKAFKPYGVSPQQYNVLRILKGQHPNAITVNSIAERMLDKNSNASRLIDKLVLKKLVERSPCEKDRRQMDVAITKVGLQLLDKMDLELNSIDFDLKKSVSKKDAQLINEVLDNMRG